MFQVPEKYRAIIGQVGSNDCGNNGLFIIPSRTRNYDLYTIVSDGEGWEHVSIHAWDKKKKKEYTPLWDEMCQMKDLFWDEDDVVIQYHPRKEDYVNNHPNVLHLWRPTEVKIPTPPTILVGIKPG